MSETNIRKKQPSEIAIRYRHQKQPPETDIHHKKDISLGAATQGQKQTLESDIENRHPSKDRHFPSDRISVFINVIAVNS